MNLFDTCKTTSNIFVYVNDMLLQKNVKNSTILLFVPMCNALLF